MSRPSHPLSKNNWYLHEILYTYLLINEIEKFDLLDFGYIIDIPVNLVNLALSIELLENLPFIIQLKLSKSNSCHIALEMNKK